MVEIFKTVNNQTISSQIGEENIVIYLTNPTEEELTLVQKHHQVELDFLKAALDQEEVSRVEIEDNQSLILINAPIEEVEDKQDISYNTMPVGIINTAKAVIVVTLENLTALKIFKDKYKFKANTNKKTRFVLQLIYEISIQYLRELRKIDRFIDSIEDKLVEDIQNDYIIQLMTLEKNLVYFSTALKTNAQVLRRVIRTRTLEIYEEDEDLIDDTLIEIGQAQEMATINSEIVRSLRDATASIISNNLNKVMKILASFTIILTVPTMIFSFFGMNTYLGFLETTNIGTLLIFSCSLLIALIIFIIMRKKNMF